MTTVPATAFGLSQRFDVSFKRDEFPFAPRKSLVDMAQIWIKYCTLFLCRSPVLFIPIGLGWISMILLKSFDLSYC